MMRVRKLICLFLITTICLTNIKSPIYASVSSGSENKTSMINETGLEESVDDEAINNTDIPEKNENVGEYYVSVDGNDLNKGTKQSPFQTIHYAISKLKPGDTLYIMEGTYTENVYLDKNVQGTAEKPIEIKAYENSHPVIIENGAVICIDGSSYVRIQGLTIKGKGAAGKDSDPCGIYIENSAHHISIMDNEICNIHKTSGKEACANGILLFGENKKSIHEIDITHNYVHDLDTGYSEAVSVTGNCESIHVRENTVENITNIGIDLSGNYGYCSDKTLDYPRNCTISNNNVSKCVSPYATSYGIYVDGGQNIDIYKNIVTECSGGIEVGAEQPIKDINNATSGILVHENKIMNNLENGLSIGGYEEKLGWVIDVRVLSNKIMNNGKNGTEITLAKCQDIYFSKNTISNQSKNATIIYRALSDEYIKNVVFDD